MSLCKIEKGKTYSLTEFKDTQFDQLKEVSKRLGEFRDLVKEIVCSACRTALFEAGFTPDNYIYEQDSPLPGTFEIEIISIRAFFKTFFGYRKWRTGKCFELYDAVQLQFGYLWRGA